MSASQNRTRGTGSVCLIKGRYAAYAPRSGGNHGAFLGSFLSRYEATKRLEKYLADSEEPLRLRARGALK